MDALCGLVARFRYELEGLSEGDIGGTDVFGESNAVFESKRCVVVVECRGVPYAGTFGTATTVPVNTAPCEREESSDTGSCWIVGVGMW